MGIFPMLHSPDENHRKKEKKTTRSGAIVEAAWIIVLAPVAGIRLSRLPRSNPDRTNHHQERPSHLQPLCKTAIDLGGEEIPTAIK